MTFRGLVPTIFWTREKGDLELGFLAVVGDAANNRKFPLLGALQVEKKMQCHIFGFGLCFKSSALI
jgi:hypothetical protein